MTTKHTADMREEFMFWFKQQATTEEECPSLLETWQAATASAEAKYLPVIEKLVEALDYLRDDFVEYWYGEQGKSADIKSIVDADKALALAAPLLGGKNA